MNKTYYLYGRDSKMKVRTVILEVLPQGEGYVIRKKSGLLTGKLTIQPEKEILKGKAKRTIEEQVELEVNSIINKQKDKGYKLLEQLVDEVSLPHVDPMDHDFIDELLAKEKKDAQGENKPMLAQDAQKTKPKSQERVKPTSWFNRAWWVSKKIDGVRTLGTLKVDEDGNDYISFTSRTGKPYKGSVKGFERDAELIQFMKDNECEIDGEIYCHGHHLNELNGDARKMDYVPSRHDKLQFWIFDIAKEGMMAADRVKILNKTKFTNEKLVVLEHHFVTSYDEIIALHDQWVEEGFEGAMGRTAIGMYEFGKRSNEIWKFKLFEDGEFKIVGIKEGARPEDMCFVLELETTNETFDCKPIGGAEQIQAYRDDLENIIGKMGTVKYFGWTMYGIPNIAKFKCVREDE